MTATVVNPTAIHFPAAWFTCPGMVNSVGSAATMTFNGAGDKIGFVWTATSTTVPDLAAFYVSSHTSTGTIDCTIETVDATTGFPTGTLVTNSATASVSVTGTGIKTAAGMAGTATISAGTEYALVLTATAGFAGTFNVQWAQGAGGNIGYPYLLTKDSGGAWTKQTTSNSGYFLGMADTGGTYIQTDMLSGPVSSFAYQGVTDSTNPDERGNRFVPTVPCTCYGAWVGLGLATTPDDTHSYALSLYSSHTATPVQMATDVFDGNIQATSTVRYLPFTSPQALSAGVTYAIAIKPTSSGGVQFLRAQLGANARLQTLTGTTTMYSTTRDGGAGAPSGGGNNFSDTNTDIYLILPVLSKYDDGAGGSGAGSPIGLVGAM